MKLSSSLNLMADLAARINDFCANENSLCQDFTMLKALVVQPSFFSYHLHYVSNSASFPRFEPSFLWLTSVYFLLSHLRYCLIRRYIFISPAAPRGARSILRGT